MGTLKFRDDKEVETVQFDKLVVGAVFEYDEMLFIKINDTYAFDVINLTIRGFNISEYIIEREAEIIFH